MLKPREADIPALFVVLVVLPVVTYIILGIWNEASKKKAKISLLTQIASEETPGDEVMASTDLSPLIPPLSFGTHVCAKCFAPATTRCSRCKSVRYCSGKCQILHWRQGHKQECQQWPNGIANSSCAEPIRDSMDRSSFMNGSSVHIGGYMEEFQHSDILSDLSDCAEDLSLDTHVELKQGNGKSDHVKLNQETFGCDGSNTVFESYNACANTRLLDVSSISTDNLFKDASIDFESQPRKLMAINGHKYGGTDVPINTIPSTVRNCAYQSQKWAARSRSMHKPSNFNDEPHESRGETTSTVNLRCHNGPVEIATDVSVPGKRLDAVDPENRFPSSYEFSGSRCSLENPVKGNRMYKKPPYTLDPLKSEARAPRIYQYQAKGHAENESRILHFPTGGPEQKCSGISSVEEMNLTRPRGSTKNPKRCLVGLINSCKKTKVLFPYEELLKLFQFEISGISPRGLVNCGNSCYANAVLQCLTFTKPLMVYLLDRSHSRTCRIRDWCLMCELEQHVAMLREGVGSLSPSKILLNMRSVGCRMGGGNQEDAHEFLRLLVMSLQAVCLEDMGGEKKVDLGLQETTLVQQIFGGRLKSKVKCLRCHHESERYENIMDLTLEIFGWVESLEDALTQFTTPEDLDGENMYRCGRCSAYVKARKQLSLHEVPNILTIVLKRFQTGKYGKINKFVTFPDWLDLIPFITDGSDNPPLYMLYAVVVHLDAENASFSGHYVSYIKDLQGTWFRINDSEVQVVPLSQVMSEGAYMLFYSRCYPRPPTSQSPSAKHNSPRPPKSPRHEQHKDGGSAISSINGENGLRQENRGSTCGENCRSLSPAHQAYVEPIGVDFSDAASSDWSLFTSSDESSFTTESTRDSFSTADHGETVGLDPISSIFGPFYVPECSPGSGVSCTLSSPTKFQTRYHREARAFVLDSSVQLRKLGGVHKARNP